LGLTRQKTEGVEREKITGQLTKEVRDPEIVKESF